MGLSIGGGLGPLRLRVGTRGFGGGVGPLGFSSGYGRRRRSGGSSGCAALLGLGLLALAIYWVVAWPWQLGAWTAVQLGAANPSVWRTAVGWLFEGTWIAAWLAGAAAAATRSSRAKAAVAEHDRVMAAAAAAQRLLEQEREQRARAEQLSNARRRRVASPEPRPMPAGVRALSGEQLLDSVTDVRLLQPRAVRGARTSEPTAVDQGTMLVTTRRVIFTGLAKNVTWSLHKVVSLQRVRQGLLLPVTSRQAVFGVTAAEDRLVELWTTLAWGLAAREQDGFYGRVLEEISREFGIAPEVVDGHPARLALPAPSPEARLAPSRSAPSVRSASDVEHDRQAPAGAEVTLSLLWEPDAGQPASTVNLVMLLLGSAGRVRSDRDLIFYNAPTTADGAARLEGRSPDAARSGLYRQHARLILHALDPSVEEVVVAASADVGRLLGLGRLTVELDLAGLPEVEFAQHLEAMVGSVVMLRLRRREDAWNALAAGDLYFGDLAELVASYGVAVDA